MSTVSLAEARNACMISYTTQDTFLQIAVDGADDFVERMTGLYLTDDDEIENVEGGGFALWPNRCPVNSVSEVYDNEAGSIESTGDYHLKRNGIYRDSDGRWDRGRVNRWRVTYNGGYETVPSGLKSIILELIVRAFRARGGQRTQNSMGYDIEWEKLTDSDMIKKLERFATAGSVFG